MTRNIFMFGVFPVLIIIVVANLDDNGQGIILSILMFDRWRKVG